MRTEFINPDLAERKWHLIDAQDKVLGKIASEAARLLRGKHKVTFNPGHDNGDFVLVINAAAVTLTGTKWQSKMYYHHTGFVGGIIGQTAEKLHARHPTQVIEKAVQGMLPKGPLGRKMLKKLFVYPTADHPHVAQKPAPHALMA